MARNSESNVRRPMGEELPDREKSRAAIRQRVSNSHRIRSSRHELLRFFRDVCCRSEAAARLKVKASAEQTYRRGRGEFEDGKDCKPSVRSITIGRVYSPRSRGRGAR
jgi:hypothetical protein